MADDANGNLPEVNADQKRRVAVMLQGKRSACLFIKAVILSGREGSLFISGCEKTQRIRKAGKQGKEKPRISLACFPDSSKRLFKK